MGALSLEADVTIDSEQYNFDFNISSDGSAVSWRQ
jgi:hypothetical protein